jgi:hypothetical protein
MPVVVKSRGMRLSEILGQDDGGGTGLLIMGAHEDGNGLLQGHNHLRKLSTASDEAGTDGSRLALARAFKYLPVDHLTNPVTDRVVLKVRAHVNACASIRIHLVRIRSPVEHPERVRTNPDTTDLVPHLIPHRRGTRWGHKARALWKIRNPRRLRRIKVPTTIRVGSDPVPAAELSGGESGGGRGQRRSELLGRVTPIAHARAIKGKELERANGSQVPAHPELTNQLSGVEESPMTGSQSLVIRLQLLRGEDDQHLPKQDGDILTPFPSITRLVPSLKLVVAVVGQGKKSVRHGRV